MRKNSVKENFEGLRNQLLAWFKMNKRALPWRQTNNAYHIWLSEIILQQTRVIQGLPYYLKFIEAYPDVFALAAAPEQNILKLWQGLGYYSRARNLHTAAKQLVNEYGGNFPSEYKEILKLKGIGDYTAAAIASIAFNKSEAVLDGNVYRVLSRIFADEMPVNSSGAKNKYRLMAQELLDKNEPGLFNEAMMELGAVICLPKNPLCLQCPVNHFCEAFNMGIQNELPKKIPKMKSRNRYLHYLLIYNKGKICIKKRHAGDIWQGLYDLPLIETGSNSALKPEEIKTPHIWEVKKMLQVYKLKHLLTHQTLHINFYDAEARLENDDFIFVSLTELKNYPLPKPVELFVKQHFNFTELY